jgi:poly(3-hydroxybutyrate) depolymerase
MLDEVATRWPCISTQKVFMMGFSGGGQFVQRFLYIYPERLMAVSIGAPGKVTLLDEGQKWPKGVKDTMSVFQRSVHVQAIKAVDIHLVVGSEDTSVHGGNEFKVWQESIKTKLENNEHTAAVTSNIGESKGGGDGRLGTLQNLQKTWEHVGIHAHLDLVQGVAHSADGVRKCVLDHLGPLLREFNDGESTDSTLS